MQSESIKTREVTDLATYRTRKVRVPADLREAIQSQKDAEDALSEIARHLLNAVRVITSRRF